MAEEDAKGSAADGEGEDPPPKAKADPSRASGQAAEGAVKPAGPKAAPREAAVEPKDDEAAAKAQKPPGEAKPAARSDPTKGDAKPAAKPEKKEAPPPPPAKTSNEDTQAFLSESEYYAPEQVEDIRPAIPAFRVPKEKLVDAMRYLRDVLHYEHLACITAIDWQKGSLEVVYNLWSYSKNRPLAVRVACTVDDPVVPSVTSVWKGADWLEREEYDLMGIHFEGHPDLRRIMLPEGWRGHPLRKDYDWKKEQFVGMDNEGNDVVFQEAREDAW